MDILIVSATLPEISPAMEALNLKEGTNVKGEHSVTVLITGVGMVATAFAMGQVLSGRKFDFALNLGIAGSFNRELSPGETVEIRQDTFSELGAEDHDRFISLPELGFGESSFFPLAPATAIPLSLRHVTALTVNTVHGNEARIREISERTGADVESMEGAAFFYACQAAGVPCVQVRSVSNYVEPRNHEAWNIPLAIKNLNTFAAKFIPALLSPQVEV
jgi:futalosine hydrolase